MRKRRADVADGQQLVHLRTTGGLEAKCGDPSATAFTNWVKGATYEEIYVPADTLERAHAVCAKCQEAALRDDAGSDDEVVADDETAGDGAAEGAVSGSDPAFAEITDDRLLRELARRLRDESTLAQEEDDEADDHRK